MKIQKKTFNKILHYLSTEHKYLLEDTEVSHRHFKLLKHDATYNQEHYKIITFTQKVATGVLLRHFIWMTEYENSFFLVNTQQKFKLTSEERKWLSQDVDYSSMYESIGGGLSLITSDMQFHGESISR
jgi:mannosyltransferase OCH1-like enzyme